MLTYLSYIPRSVFGAPSVRLTTPASAFPIIHHLYHATRTSCWYLYIRKLFNLKAVCSSIPLSNGNVIGVHYSTSSFAYTSALTISLRLVYFGLVLSCAKNPRCRFDQVSIIPTVNIHSHRGHEMTTAELSRCREIKFHQLRNLN